MQNTRRSGSRGVSLVEAMVALAVMAFGMLAVVGVQSTLRLNADIAKQRSEATLIAQETMERNRSFTLIEAPDGVASWSTIVTDAVAQDVTGLNAVYRVKREVTYDQQPTKVLRVTVSWDDRSGQTQSVVLNSSIAAAAPALSGTLAVRAGNSPVAPVRRPYQRHPTIPVQARDFGDGRSAFVLPNQPWLVIVFNNVTGAVTSFCDIGHFSSNDDIEPSDVQSCANMAGQLLTGFIRFVRSTSGPDLTAADVEDPIGPALNLRMHVNLTSSGHPRDPICHDDMNGTNAGDGSKRFATYYCVVFSNNSLLWSGGSTMESLGADNGDWRITNDTFEPDSYRVCRYTSATSDNQSVPNAEHPRNYVDVSGNLTNQNFVVIRSVKHCPTDGPADPVNGDFISSNTLQHQPTPSP